LLSDLARLYLLLESYHRLDALPAGLQQEIRSQIGWAQDQAELQQQPGERDHWLVLGRREAVVDRLQVRRTWLWGVQRRRAALILDFAAPGKPFNSALSPGTDLDADLVFWPSSVPLRATIAAHHAARPMASLPGYPSIEDAFTAYGAGLARNPWLARFLMPLAHVVPLPAGRAWIARDSQGCTLRLALPPNEGWRLMALSGGRPMALIGEWSRQHLEVLSAWTGQELVAIGGEA
jgi:hypothetical protein